MGGVIKGIGSAVGPGLGTASPQADIAQANAFFFQAYAACTNAQTTSDAADRVLFLAEGVSSGFRGISSCMNGLFLQLNAIQGQLNYLEARINQLR